MPTPKREYAINTIVEAGSGEGQRPDFIPALGCRRPRDSSDIEGTGGNRDNRESRLIVPGANLA
jgi:hypothetical protein